MADGNDKEREMQKVTERQIDRCINRYIDGLGAWGLEGEAIEEAERKMERRGKPR